MVWSAYPLVWSLADFRATFSVLRADVKLVSAALYSDGDATPHIRVSRLHVWNVEQWCQGVIILLKYWLPDLKEIDYDIIIKAEHLSTKH